MIELRWVPTKPKTWKDGPIGFYEESFCGYLKLQYRESIGENGDLVILWTGWKDVPVVEE